MQSEAKNRIAGKTRRVVGRITKNRSMELKGAAQETVGKAQGATRRGRQRVRGIAARYRIRRPARGLRTRTTRREQAMRR